MTNSISKFSHEKLELLRRAGQNKLISFSQLLDPKFEAVWFHDTIAAHLEKALEDVVVHKRKARIIITIPPRHGKSRLTSVNFAAWALGKYPDLPIILSTYGAELAEKHGMDTRDVIATPQYQSIFPGVTLRPDVKAKAKWMTNKKGSYTAVGIGGAVTGVGGKIILIDDPHKDRAEAESATVRDNVWQYYRSTLYSRLEGYGAVIVIMQRWHTDDLIGRLLEEEERNRAAGLPTEDWLVINFPAIAEEDEQYRKAGEALWPNKFPLPVLENIRNTQGTYNWAAQYMQDPILSASQEFKEHMFRYYEESDLQTKYLRYYTFIDPAISQKSEADNTVVLTVAKEVMGPNWYRIREDAGHYTPTQTVDLIFAHQSAYKSEVHIETVQYQKALQFAVIEEQRKRQQYFTVKEIKSQQNKELRIRSLLPLYEAGVIYHKHSDVEYERELLAFPRGKRDDRIDCCAFGPAVVENTGQSQIKQFKKKFTGYFQRR